MNLAIHDLVQQFVDPRSGTQATVLDGLDLETGDIQALVLVGPSGGGKSTLLRILAGLDVPTAGTVAFDGEPLPRSEEGLISYRRTVGTVFQAYNLFPHLTVLENLTLAPTLVRQRPKREVEQQALDLLERVGIHEQARKYPGQLSGGQQQRVAIARSLCMEPRIMLFDEPTSALDPEMVQEVLAVMQELARDGMTMVVVTHEVRFARQVASRVVLMADGQVVEEAPPEQFFTNPQHERSRQFLSQIS
jgi:general L-amino acid transport system ATP-binding protein